MTEQDFLKQTWRPYDKITTTNGVPGKVLGVNFSTRSVRAYISGAPEWVTHDLIETHTTGAGIGGDDASTIAGLKYKIDELETKISRYKDEILGLREKNRELNSIASVDKTADLLKAVNLVQQGLIEKKHKIEQVESGLKQIHDALSKMYLIAPPPPQD